MFMQQHDLGSSPITTSDGRLIGLLRREDAISVAHEQHEHRADATPGVPDDAAEPHIGGSRLYEVQCATRDLRVLRAGALPASDLLSMSPQRARGIHRRTAPARRLNAVQTAQGHQLGSPPTARRYTVLISIYGWTARRN